MEYVDGVPLDVVIRAQSLHFIQVDELARGILDGVIAAHAQGIIHRDLKPGNVMLDLTGGRPVPRVTDFGLARILAAEGDIGARATRTGSSFGTPAYMSPEQFRDVKGVDARSDVWALGALLYELLTGRPAFPSEHYGEMFVAVHSGNYPPIEELLPDAPARVRAAIDEALQPDVEDRCGSVRALMALWTGSVPVPPAASWDMESLRELR
jgi:serine/threonine-protein kinase